VEIELSPPLEIEFAGIGAGTMTAAEILEKLLQVDGHLSDLDADTVDGKHSSDFVPTTRQVNSKALSADIVLTASDVGSEPIFPAGSLIDTPQYSGGLICDGSYHLRSAYPTIASEYPNKPMFSTFTLPTSQTWNAVAKNSNNVICLISNGTMALTSADNGANWTQQTLPSTGFTGIAALGTLFVAVKSDFSNQIAYSSNNGAAWTAVNYGGNGNYWFGGGIISNGSVLCAIGNANSSAMFTSADGINWTKRPAPTTISQNVIAIVGTTFIVASANIIFYSINDGVTWTQVYGPLNTIWLCSVVYNSTLYLFGTTSTTTVGNLFYMKTTDGVSWEQGFINKYGQWAWAVSFDSSLFVGSQASGVIIRTNDIVNFDVINSSATYINSKVAIALSDSVLIFPIVGTGGIKITVDATYFKIPAVSSRKAGNYVYVKL
jgi:hypothetical protein